MKIKNQTFCYHPPSMPDDHTLSEGWFAVSHHFLDEDIRTSRRYYSQWHRISCGKMFVYRCLRLSPNLRKNDADSEIALDWAAWCMLAGENTRSSAQLTIRKAYIIEPMIFGGHPDPATRTAYQIAFVSLLLAIISMLVTLAPLL